MDNGVYLCPQGATLRAGFPKEAKSHPVYGVLDDSKLQALLKKGKVWTGKARQCLQTMQAGRPMASSLLFGLVEEAQAIKLNLSPEVCALSSTTCTLVRRLTKHLRFAVDGDTAVVRALTVISVERGVQHTVLPTSMKHVLSRCRPFVDTPSKQTVL